MTRYALTGATGALGRLVVDELLARGTAPGDVVALVRDPARAADLTARGVEVRTFDYDAPGALTPALSGVDVLLLVSGSEVGQRVRQHGAVIDAAVAAGVGRLVYTSVLHADTTDNPVAPEHRATEALLRDAGIPTAVLRNGWYTENYLGLRGAAAATGTVPGATRGATLNAATRADYAAAAATALLDAGTAGRTFELGGPGFTLTDLAAAFAESLGRPVDAVELTPADLAARLRAAGLDEGTAGFLVGVDVAAAGGALTTDPVVLEQLAGRPLTPMPAVVRAS